MNFELPTLPYPKDALEPHISAETLEYHHGKHHAKYVNTLNDLIKNTEYADKPLDDIIKTSEGSIFNNAAQTFNHDFYWKCLSPESTEPSPELKSAIEKKFGSMDEFIEAFSDSATTLFGSGWTWLVIDDKGELSIRNGNNANTPIRWGDQPLLTCDVWEHAYYIDHRNARPEYVKGFWKLVNWDFVSQNYRTKS